MKWFTTITSGVFFVMCAISVIVIGLPSFAWSVTVIIDADSQYAYAQERFDSEAYNQAVFEFNRFIHFFPDDVRRPRARFQIGMAHFLADQYQEAVRAFTRLTENFDGTPLSNDAYLMLSRSHARLAMTEQAMVDLHNLMALSSDPGVMDRARYELGWLHVEKDQWGPAIRTFGHITPYHRDRYQVDELEQALEKSVTIPYKSPSVAGFLSIVPGGGQFYTKRYQDALTAFLINAGLIWAAWEAFDNENYALGSVISFVEVGFYSGNIYGAISSAHKYNRDQASVFRERLKQHRQMPLSLAPMPGGFALCLSVNF